MITNSWFMECMRYFGIASNVEGKLEKRTDITRKKFRESENRERQLPRGRPVPTDLCAIHDVTNTDSETRNSHVCIQKPQTEIEPLISHG